jgi:small-conductance mechanosensitive channel
MASFELRQFLDFTVLSIGKTNITVNSLIAVLIFIVAIYFLLKLIRKSIYRIRAFDEAKKFSAYTIIKICIIILSSILALEILGFSLSVLMAGSAALLVGLGLGLQNLFSDYISGIIILVTAQRRWAM